MEVKIKMEENQEELKNKIEEKMEQEPLKKMLWMNFNIGISILAVCVATMFSTFTSNVIYKVLIILLILAASSIYLIKCNKDTESLL